MRLQADDDEILRAEFDRIVGAARLHDVLFVTDQQLQAVGLHRFKVCTAGDETDVGSHPSELDAEIAADGTGTVDADFHWYTPKQTPNDPG